MQSLQKGFGKAIASFSKAFFAGTFIAYLSFWQIPLWHHILCCCLRHYC